MVENKKLKFFRSMFACIILFFAISNIFPMLLSILVSLKENVTKGSFSLSFNDLSLSNYQFIFQHTKVSRWFFNSCFVSGVSTLVVLYLSILAAYPLAKKQFPGANFLFWLAIIFMTVPRDSYILPLFKRVMGFGWVNTYWGLILPSIARPMALFMMVQYIKTLPSELFDAAAIDGCSTIRTIHTILIPLSKPVLGTLAIFNFVQIWNDYFWQLIVTNSSAMATMPVGVASLNDEFMSFGRIMAGAIIGALPMLIVFLLFQKYFTKGITTGAIKG